LLALFPFAYCYTFRFRFSLYPPPPPHRTAPHRTAATRRARAAAIRSDGRALPRRCSRSIGAALVSGWTSELAATLSSTTLRNDPALPPGAKDSADLRIWTRCLPRTRDRQAQVDAAHL
jgi:hypothetical protein